MHFIRKLYPDSIIVAGLGKYQDTDSKRINAWKKGYQKGQPDLMIMNYKKNYFGCCIEFKSPKNNYQVSEAQREMKHKYRNNGYYFMISNDCDVICKNIHKYMEGIRVPGRYCCKYFLTDETFASHLKWIHRIKK